MSTVETAVTPASAGDKRSMPFLVGLAVYLLGINYVWFSYGSILLPLQVESVVPASAKGFALGAILSVSIAAGLVLNILAGAYSDRARSRWGRRTPTILSGMLLSVPFLLLVVLFPLSLVLVSIVYFGLQLFSNFSSGGYQPLLADLVPEHQRGAEAGLQGGATLVGSALAYGATGYLASQGRMPLAIIVLTAAFVVTTLVTVITIRRLDHPGESTRQAELVLSWKKTLRVREAAPFFWFVLASFAILMGAASFQSFGLYYLETVLQVVNAAGAMAVTGLLSLLISILAALLAGSLSDRLGRRNLILGAAILAGFVNLLFPFVREFGVFLMISCVYAAMLGVFLSVNMALAADLVPKSESGTFMAFNNLAVGGANALAPLVGGLVLSGGRGPSPSSFVLLFALASVYYLSGAGLLFKIPNR